MRRACALRCNEVSGETMHSDAVVDNWGLQACWLEGLFVLLAASYAILFIARVVRLFTSGFRRRPMLRSVLTEMGFATTVAIVGAIVTLHQILFVVVPAAYGPSTAGVQFDEREQILVLGVLQSLRSSYYAAILMAIGLGQRWFWSWLSGFPRRPRGTGRKGN